MTRQISHLEKMVFNFNNQIPDIVSEQIKPLEQQILLNVASMDEVEKEFKLLKKSV